MPLLKYTTRVPVVQTVAEVTKMLVGVGAQSVTQRFDAGRLVGLSFVLVTPHGERWYSLPVNVDGVQRVLAAQYRSGELGRASCSPEQACRAAWRIARDWLAVQLALVEAQMATVDQIMLPYLQVDQDAAGRVVTLYDRYCEHEQLALSVGDEAR